MSSKIDERIVGMKFNGDQFNKGVADTSSALGKLKQALNLDGAAKGLGDVEGLVRNFSLSNMANGIQGIMDKFGALSIVGFTALTNIANKAVDAGITIMRSLTIDPVKAGFAEYELKMGSIQTILANTARYGTQLPEVVSNLDELNSYADKTIYNFGDMTKNIGLFTNAGIKIGDATSMIKGFSNEAAASGTSSQGAAGAAYQLSQALSAGTIRLMDWRSLQNVGMGNKNMQNGLIEIAQAMGQFNENTTDASTASANFNGSLEHNWLSADVMSTYLKIMAGDMDAATQASLGLTDAQIAGFAKQQKMSEEAATKVRTYTQLLGTLQESVGSGWSQTFDYLIGDFDKATELWTNVNNELGGFIGEMSDARNELIKGFVDIGGREELIAGIANIWKAFKQYLMPIKSAWQEIFPPIQAGNLLAIAKAFTKITDALRPSGEQMAQIKRIFQGVFAVLDIGRMVVVEVFGVLTRLFGAATAGAGSFLEVGANVGDFLVKIRDAIKNGTALETFFRKLGDVIQWPIDKLRQLGAWTVDTVTTWNFAKAWEAIAEAFRKVGEFLAPVWQELGNFFRDAKKVIGEFFETLDFNVLIGLMNLGALGAIGIGLKKAFDFFKGKGIMGLIFGDNKDSGPGLMDRIKGIFGAITDTFSEMQNTLKSATLIGIAIAIGLISASVLMLSFVDTGKLFITLGAMTIMFGQLSAMIVAIDKLTKTVGAAKMIGVAIALSLLAGSMILMATAILIMSTMDWVELARGLTGMTVGLGVMVGAVMLIDKVKQEMITGAIAIGILSVSMVILAAAMKIFASMSWDDILRGGTVLIGAVGALVGAGKLASKGVKGMGALMAMSTALLIMSGALKVFATMSWDDIGRAMTVMAGAIGIMVGAMMLLDLMKNIPVGALTMLAMAAVLNLLIAPFKAFSEFSWEGIGKIMVVMAGALAILAGAMALMGIPIVALGGVALFVVSAGLMMLAPALALLGTMSWDAIGRGLTMLGASLAILAVGGLLLIPASVGFFLLGAAVLMIGGGMMMAGQGVAIFVAGLTALIGLVAVGAPAIKTALETIAGSIPTMMAAFAQGLIDFALVIAQGAIEFTAAATTLIYAMMMGIQQNAPLIIDTIWLVIQSLVNKVVEAVPFFVDAGMKLLIGILDGIGNNIGRVIDSATNLIVNFMDGISRNLPRIIQSGANLIISFVQGLADGIRNNKARMQAAAKDLANEIISGLTFGLSDGIGRVVNEAKKVAERALNAAKNFLGIKSPSREFMKVGAWSTEGMAIGLEKTTPLVTRAAENVGNGALTAMQKSLSNLKNAVATDMEFAPTIRPILDLTNVQKNSALIGGMLTPPTLKVDDSYAYAASIATSQREYAEARDDGDGDGPRGDTYNFTQNNTSPKALPAAEIYRQTNNQLSVVKKGQPTGAN